MHTSHFKGQKTIGFCPSSLILVNYFLPLKQALPIQKLIQTQF
jgi:hypothetical protein